MTTIRHRPCWWQVCGAVVDDAEHRTDWYAGGTDASGGAWNGPLTDHWIGAFEFDRTARSVAEAVRAVLVGDSVEAGIGVAVRFRTIAREISERPMRDAFGRIRSHVLSAGDPWEDLIRIWRECRGARVRVENARLMAEAVAKTAGRRT